MTWAYKLFWTAVASIAIAAGLSACSQPKSEKTVRLNPKLADGTSVTTPAGSNSNNGPQIPTAGNGRQTTVAIREGAVVTLTSPTRQDQDLGIGESNFLFTTAAEFSATGASSFSLVAFNIVTTQTGTQISSDRLPSLSGNWQGAYVTQCGDDLCNTYYMAIYLNNGTNYRVVGLKYRDGSTIPSVITYPLNEVPSYDRVYLDLDKSEDGEG